MAALLRDMETRIDRILEHWVYLELPRVISFVSKTL